MKQDVAWFVGRKLRELLTSKFENIFQALSKKYQTPGSVAKKERGKMANQQKIRIRLRAYDHEVIDSSAEKIVEAVKRSGAEVSGPIPLPTEIERITILRAVHKYKDSREQFEQRTHKRLIDIIGPNAKTLDALKKLNLPAGVDIEIKL